ncbi:MAG: type II methionyl aminopeptidase [Candidatus Woesearchaeota archaeon]
MEEELDEEVIENYKKAGSIAARALDFGRRLVKEGESLVFVMDKIEEKIKSLGAEIAFPAQISLNNIAAHYCSVDDKETFKFGDVVKIDIGTHINGYIGDCALTVYIGDDKNIKNLLESARSALENALKVVKPGVRISEIGKIIQKTISSYGFYPVRNLSGHGLERFNLHAEPSIPNYDTNNNLILKKDSVIAIEPFSSTGVGIVGDSGNATVYSLIKSKPVRNNTARKILREIESYNGLPFTTRWFYKKYPKILVDNAIREFLNNEMIYEYKPLSDIGKGFVAQFEHTVIVRESKNIITTLLEE